MSWCIVHQTMAHSNSNIHQYQHTCCSSKANTIPFRIFNHERSAVCHCHCSWIAGECAIAFVPWLIVQQVMIHSNSNVHQHQLTSCSSKANTIHIHIFNQHQRRAGRMSLALYLNSRRVCNCDGVIVLRILSNDTFKFNANVLPVHPKPTRYRSIYSININVIVACLNSRRVCNCDSIIIYLTTNNDTFKFKHAPILTYCLFVQSQNDTYPYIQSTSIQAQGRMSLPL